MEKLYAKKNLGQNFLKDKKYAIRMVEKAFPSSMQFDNVIEIGPGQGSLTKILLQKSNIRNLIAIEKDERMKEVLLPLQSEYPHFTPIFTDAMNICENNIVDGDFHIIGNLPYNIGGRLLYQWLIDIANGVAIKSITVMLQKEFASRVLSSDGKSYGPISIIANILCEREKICDVPPSAFTPKPKITSSIIRLVNKNVSEESRAKLLKLEEFLKSSFAMRRKTFLNNIKPYCKKYDVNIEKFTKYGNIRAENIPSAEYMNMEI